MKPLTLLISFLALTAAYVACGDESTSSETEPVATSLVEPTADLEPESSIVTPTEPQPSTTTVPAQSTPPTSAATTTGVPVTTPSASTPATTEALRAAPCGAEAIFPVVAALFPENEFWNPVAVDVL